MFSGDPDAKRKANDICDYISKHDITKSHARHFSYDLLSSKGLKVTLLEELGDVIQDTVLTIHHAFMHTFSNSTAIKIVENHKGIRMIFNGPPLK